MKRYILVILIVIISVAVSAGEERELDTKKLVDRMHAIKEGMPVETYDSNGDGKIDFLEKMDEDGNKIVEILDFNHDGSMDDFYYYTDGIISLREVDSNFDNKIDVWVYIKEGHYITKYERDLDFNGTVDQVKIFGDEE